MGSSNVFLSAGVYDLGVPPLWVVRDPRCGMLLGRAGPCLVGCLGLPCTEAAATVDRTGPSCPGCGPGDPGAAGCRAWGVPGLGLAGWWAGKLPALMRQRGHSCRLVDLLPVLAAVLLEESPWLPASLGGSRRPARGANTGPSQ